MLPISSEIDTQLDATLLEEIPAEKLQLAQTALSDSLAIHYEAGIAAAHTLQGFALWQLNKLPEAIDNLDKAGGEFSRLPTSKWKALLHIVYGHVYRTLGVYEQAVERYLLGRNLAKEMNDKSLMINAQEALGVVSMALGDYSKSIASLHETLRLLGDTTDHEREASIYINLSATYYYLGDFQNVALMAQKALAVAETRTKILSGHNNLAVAYTRLGEYNKAKFHFEQSMSYARSLGSALYLAQETIDFADYHIQIGDEDRAVELLLEGLRLAESIDFKVAIKDCHQHLYTLFRNHGDWERALYHHEQLYTVEKAIFNDNSDTRIRNLEILHKVEQLRETNERQQREFDAITELKDALLSDLSHDLKNPLTILKAARYLLEHDNPDLRKHPALTQFLEQMELQVDRMTQLITDVLDMAQLDTGARIDLQRTNISELVSEVCTEHGEKARTKNITIRSNFVDIVYALADANTLRRGLENLMSNAIKYTLVSGCIEVETKCINENQAMIRIKDHGIGIPQEALPHIFDRFYRVPSHVKVAEGTGLGLAIVKSIVEKHNGTIEVESQVNQGTTFTIALPVAGAC